MTSNVTALLRDIDGEIVKHRQEIAKHRLWISQLEDTRLNLMQLVENKAAANGQVSPFGALPEGIEIAVRDQLPAPETKRSVKIEHAARAKAETKSSKPPAKRGGRLKEDTATLRGQILALLKAEGPLISMEIGDRLGLPRGDKPRKPMANSLYYMRKILGQIDRDQNYAYFVKA